MNIIRNQYSRDTLLKFEILKPQSQIDIDNQAHRNRQKTFPAAYLRFGTLSIFAIESDVA